MKKLLLALVAIVGLSLSAVAQDVIVLKNAEEVQAKVESIGLQEVVYRKSDNLEGPTYAIAKSEVLFIKYANGKKDVFVAQETPSPRPKFCARQEDFNKKLQGYIYLDMDFAKKIHSISTSSISLSTDGKLGVPALSVSLGSRISKYLYIGGGIGWRNNFYDQTESWNDYIYGSCQTVSTYWYNNINVTADLKLYYPTKCGLYPRFDLSFGPSIGGYYSRVRSFSEESGKKENISEPTNDYKCGAGIYLSMGVGFDYSRVSFGIGYQRAFGTMPSTPYSGYIRLGYRFGKKK
jgi:hypothetical protein